MASNLFKVRNAFIVNDENGYWNVFVTGITNDSGLTQDSEYNLVTEWAIKRNLADALLVLNSLSLTGLTDVDFSGLTQGQYMMFSGGTWINVDGSNIYPTYTNEEATPTTIGGVEAGSTFSAVTLQDMWTDLLYPYQHPTLSAFRRDVVPSTFGSLSDLTVEVGFTLSAGAATSFQWTYDDKGKPENAPDNLVISDVTTPTTLATGIAIDGSPTGLTTALVQKTSVATHNWEIKGTDTSDQDYSDTTYIRWYWYFYYGESANSVLTESDIEGLTTNTLKNSVSLSYTFAATATYKYYCFPSTYTMSDVKNVVTGLDVDMAGVIEGYTDGFDVGTTRNIYYKLVSVTNSYSQNINYKVFRSRFILNGTVKFIYT